MSFLRHLLDLPLLVVLMMVGCISMALPAAYALVLGNHPVARAFFYSGIVLLILTAMIALAKADYRPRLGVHSQLAAVVGSYLILPVILAVPVHQAMPGLSFSAAWFEMLSCFTMTGATLFDAPEQIAAPIHLWRAMIGWLGGFYTLLVTAAVLAPIGLGGVELLGARASGHAEGSIGITRIAEPSQRIIHYSATIFPIYAGLTLILWVALLLAGDSALVALCHAMGTLSTSGISPIGGLGGASSGLLGEGMIFFCFGLAVTRRLWPGVGMEDRGLTIGKDPELRLAIAIVVLVTLVLVVHRFAFGADSDGFATIPVRLRVVWGAAFATLSFLTTTGYQAASWPALGAPGLFLLGLAIIGGGVATTAGGIKLLRVYALLRHGERELERIVHPHSIGGHGPVARRLRREGAFLAWIFFMIFGLSIAGIATALTLTGLEFHEALVLGIACLTTTGQLAGVIGEMPPNYSRLGTAPLGVLGLAMIMGRLEILAVLALLVPKGWSR